MDKRASAAASRDEISIGENFARFYEIYPRKRDRGDALKAFNAALKKKTATDLIEACRRYADFVRTTSQEKRFIPYAASWLRAEAWDDDLEGETKPMTPKRLSDADIWRLRLKGFKASGGWSPTWGPPPGRGCDAPVSILSEFGLSP